MSNPPGATPSGIIILFFLCYSPLSLPQILFWFRSDRTPRLLLVNPTSLKKEKRNPSFIPSNSCGQTHKPHERIGYKIPFLSFYPPFLEEISYNLDEGSNCNSMCEEETVHWEIQLREWRMEVSGSLISKVYSSFSSNGLHFATPLSSLRASEIELVRFLVFLPTSYHQNLIFMTNL